MLLPGCITPPARLRHPVAAVEVDADDAGEVFGGLRGGGRDARVVDQDVDPAELGQGRFRQGLAVAW